MSARKFSRLAFVASPRPEAQEARDRLIARYGSTPENEADVIVALGGDGFMLQTLHMMLESRRAPVPVFGMNLALKTSPSSPCLYLDRRISMTLSVSRCLRMVMTASAS